MSRLTVRVILLALIAATLGAFAFRGGGTIQVTAYFDQFKGIYKGDDVTVRGVPVGSVTSVEPQKDQVKVTLDLDPDVHIPTDVKAAVIAQSLVAVRSIALGPVTAKGASLEDGDEIPISRTAIPVEWDDIKDQLVSLSTALGPNGANRNGATSDLVTAGAAFLDGTGESLNQTIRNMSEAMSTLSDNSGDLFATVRNLQVFIEAIKGSDTQVRLFNERLATVSASLEEDSDALVGALKGLDRAFKEIDAFLVDNRDITVKTLREVRATTSLLSENRQSVADLLQVAPSTVSNFYNILDTRGDNGAMITGELAVNNLKAPAQIICGALLAMGGDRVACQQALGPLVQYLAMNAPPVGTSLLESGGTGEQGSIEPGGKQKQQSPSSNSEPGLVDDLLGGKR
ncbi:MCE family protein [Nocardioides sp. NPDC101246]|uniref:MCE family protein n=1 Tax=Nocardioides sp. NPDC101246 TaxID=3364336 RepID=UPI0037F2491E